ncbi:MAG: 2-oxoglutarate dehydrogenase complex dihydrolipoyllysine-residue succinyltransferase [Bacteroidales bacterium]
MEIKITIPSPGESIHEVTIAQWLVENGAFVEKDAEIAELESDKATLTLVAEESGIINILIPQGKTVEVGSVACIISTEQNVKAPEVKEKALTTKNIQSDKQNQNYIKITPVAKKMMEDFGMNPNELNSNNLERITTDVIKKQKDSPKTDSVLQYSRNQQTIELTPLRKKLSERLMQAKNATAMLTTFNEVDITAIFEIRNRYKEIFTQKHGIKLGFMTFFAKAAITALQEFPIVNARLDEDKLIYSDYIDLGIAVQTEKGLVVPVIRNAESKTFAQIETEIYTLAEKARNKKISIAELEGGTFSITNGGVFGSLLATPLLNYPQTAILGMHAVQQRPVVIENQIVARPMMYIALSYDHRVLDGKDSILFLKRIKELIENPQLMFNNLSIEKYLDI